jgi:hypothetical protein
MKKCCAIVAAIVACVVVPVLAAAQVSAGALKSISTPDTVESRIGAFAFKDGMPNKETLDKVYDNLDFTHAFEAFVNTMQGVNMAAAHKGPSRYRRQGQRDPDFLQIDGCQFVVLDG